MYSISYIFQLGIYPVPNHNSTIILQQNTNISLLYVDWPLPHQNATLICRTCKSSSCRHSRTIVQYIEDDQYSSELTNIAFQLSAVMKTRAYTVPASFSATPISFFPGGSVKAKQVELNKRSNEGARFFSTNSAVVWPSCSSMDGVLLKHLESILIFEENTLKCTSKSTFFVCCVVSRLIQSTIFSLINSEFIFPPLHILVLILNIC